MIKVKRIDHVAIAVGERDGATQQLGALFGLCEGAREHVATQNVDVAFLHAGDAPGPGADDTSIEIVAPGETGTDASSNVGLRKFIDKRGPGLHHICFEVDDLPAALASLKAAGVRLIDDTPRPGARGHMVAFLHPASTGGILFELCATPHGAQA